MPVGIDQLLKNYCFSKGNIFLTQHIFLAIHFKLDKIIAIIRLFLIYYLPFVSPCCDSLKEEEQENVTYKNCCTYSAMT